MDKFVYSENEIEIAHTQCEFCIYNNPKTPEKCEQYEKKPEEVVKNKIRCPLAKDNLTTPW